MLIASIFTHINLQTYQIYRLGVKSEQFYSKQCFVVEFVVAVMWIVSIFGNSFNIDLDFSIVARAFSQINAKLKFINYFHHLQSGQSIGATESVDLYRVPLDVADSDNPSVERVRSPSKTVLVNELLVVNTLDVGDLGSCYYQDYGHLARNFSAA